MIVKLKYTVAKEFSFQKGDEVKIIETSFLFATKAKPERVYTATLTEIENDGFWAVLHTATVHPFSEKERLLGEIRQLDEEELFYFNEVEDVISAAADYPDRSDALTKFALDGL